ncbi:DUF2523 family protein [Oceanobacter mangrovi]|uniref:DUF2523 family protein n=1 Tax=Oceanobacter mangrovi TaxID=2862510 RepID=UPI001C8DE94B|nr:DUF2523 family protein [Oceanobacter mangrovi]
MIKTLCLLFALVLPLAGYAEDTSSSDTTTETTTESSSESESSSDSGSASSSSSSGDLSVTGFLKEVLGFFDFGIYEILGDFFKYYVSAVALFQLELKMAAIDLAAETATALVEYLDISGTINDLLAKVDLKMAAFISYLKIPEAITMLLSAHLTRFIMDLV